MIHSAGAINSSQVLMLSGIGPEDVLSAAGVPLSAYPSFLSKSSVLMMYVLELNLPEVGQHLQDHIVRQFTVHIVSPSNPTILLNRADK